MEQVPVVALHQGTRKSVLSWSILWIVLSAVLASGVTYLICNRQDATTEAALQAQIRTLESQLAVSLTAAPTPKPEATTARQEPDTAEHWITYTNKNGYSIQHPPTRALNLLSLGDGDSKQPDLTGATKVFLQDSTQSTRTLSISTILCGSKQTLAGVTQALVNSNADNGISSREATTIGGKEAYSIQVTGGIAINFCGNVDESSIPSSEYSSPASITVTPDGNKVFVFVNSPATDTEGIRMLSTAQFTE